jgi:hypothetical protein
MEAVWISEMLVYETTLHGITTQKNSTLNIAVKTSNHASFITAENRLRFESGSPEYKPSELSLH